jgi:hypothetical protein
MRLIQRIAHYWGSEDHQGGKRVWSELDTTATAIHDETDPPGSHQPAAPPAD